MRRDLAADAGLLEDVHALHRRRVAHPQRAQRPRDLFRPREGAERRVEVVQRVPELVHGQRLGLPEGRGSARSDECRGGVQRRQTELKGVEGGDCERGTLGGEKGREKSLRIGVHHADGVNAPELARRLVERVLLEEERDVVPAVQKVRVRRALLVHGAEHAARDRGRVERVEELVRAREHRADLGRGGVIGEDEEAVVLEALRLLWG
eukprot:30885-Pelagococcus_subviridis.AAC.5